MKHRNPLLVLVFSIITLGIYDLYWLASTGKAMNARNTQRKVPSIWLLLSPLALFILGIGIVIMERDSGPGGIISALLFVIGLIYGVIISFIWFWKYSKAVNEYTAGQMNFPMTFLLIWVLHFIGLIFIQDSFNDHLASAANGPAATPPPQGQYQAQAAGPAQIPQANTVPPAPMPAAPPASPVPAGMDNSTPPDSSQSQPPQTPIS